MDPLFIDVFIDSGDMVAALGEVGAPGAAPEIKDCCPRLQACDGAHEEPVAFGGKRQRNPNAVVDPAQSGRLKHPLLLPRSH